MSHEAARNTRKDRDGVFPALPLHSHNHPHHASGTPQPITKSAAQTSRFETIIMGHYGPFNDASTDHLNMAGDPNAGHPTIDQAPHSGSDSALPGNTEQRNKIIVLKLTDSYNLNK